MENRMEPLRCAECSAQVLVQKNSWEHTSIQWNADARRRCPQVQDDAGRDGRPGAQLGLFGTVGSQKEPGGK